MVGHDNTRCIQEGHDDPAADAPAREADGETKEILNKALSVREVSVGKICDRVDAGLTNEFFAEIFSIVLDDVVVPENVESARMTPPADKEDSAPQGHDDREDTSHRRSIDVPDINNTEPNSE